MGGPARGSMANTRSIVLPLLLLVAAAFCTVSFVAPAGAASRAASSPLAMQARGGAEGKQPSPGGGPIADPTSFIYGLSVFAWLSVVAQLRGFFNADGA